MMHVWCVLFGFVFTFISFNATCATDSDLHTSYKNNGTIVECFICRFAAKTMLEFYLTRTSEDCVSELVALFCNIFEIENSLVCSSISSQFKEEVLYVVGQLLLSPDQFCGFMFPNDCGTARFPGVPNWNVTFPEKPQPLPVPPVLPNKDAPKLRVVHLTDIHYDKLYTPGTNVHCSDPLCCRLYETSDNSTFESAGFWGSVNEKCDIPLWTLENLFQHLQHNETFDYIIWTGDLPAHNVWNQTKDDQLEAYQTLADLFLKYFPNKTIYSAVGNHESAPVDSFPPHLFVIPDKFSISWLYNALEHHWTNWINKSESIEIKKTASYVAKPFPGLRIISLNTMYCYNTNFWVYLNETDPDNELSWLIAQLDDAEDKGDKVHIIGHVLPGQCMTQWSENYYKIVNRYENTIRGQFFGHTHADEFGVFYENANYSRRATNVYYVAPSVTTFDKRNPAYRVYVVDGNYSNSTWRVLNHETYYLNATEANRSNKTDWMLEYDAKTAFGMNTLLPQEWSDLILKMQSDEKLFGLYNTFFNRRPTHCDELCKFEKLCSMRSALSNRRQDMCNDLSNHTRLLKTQNHFFASKRSWIETVLKYFRKIKDALINNIPDKCKPKRHISVEATEMFSNVSTNEVSNLSLCWLLFPSSKSANSTLCRNLCQTFVGSAPNGKQKLSHVKRRLCATSSICCV